MTEESLKLEIYQKTVANLLRAGYSKKSADKRAKQIAGIK